MDGRDIDFQLSVENYRLAARYDLPLLFRDVNLGPFVWFERGHDRQVELGAPPHMPRTQSGCGAIEHPRKLLR